MIRRWIACIVMAVVAAVACTSIDDNRTPSYQVYIKLNTALGGSWGGEVAEGTCPTDFQIDYVRVYQ